LWRRRDFDAAAQSAARPANPRIGGDRLPSISRAARVATIIPENDRQAV